MKIFSKNKGAGSFIVKDPKDGKKYTVGAGRMSDVPDDVGERLMAQYPLVLTTDEGVKTAQVATKAIQSELDTAKARIKELESQVAKLQLIAAEITPAAADEAKPAKRGRPAKVDAGS